MAWKVNAVIFNGLFVLTIILYALISLQVWQTTAVKYLKAVTSVTEIYISLFLIFRFNPFRTPHPLTNIERQIIFSAGLFVFTSSVIGEIMQSYLNEAKTDIIGKVEENTTTA